MKFGTLKINNFLTLGEASLSLADRGLLLIQGCNEDDSSASSNGAGKSSIVDALSWCLFGVTARGVSGDKVVNRLAGKDCLVGVDLHDDDGSIYSIVRHRKHKTGKNNVTLRHNNPSFVAALDLTQGTDKLTQEKIEQVLGCSYDVFCAAVYAGQERMPDLPGMTDKQLKLLVEEAAGVTLLEAAYAEARSHMSRIETDARSAHADAERWEREIALAKGHKEQVERDISDWETRRADRIVDLDLEKQRTRTLMETLTSDIAGMNVPLLKSALEKVRKAIAGVASEREEERRLDAILSVATTSTVKLKTNLDTLRSRHERVKQDIAEIDKRVGMPCDECGKDYCEHDIADAKRLAQEKGKAIAVEFSTVKTSLENAIAERQSVRESLEAFRASMTDVSAQTRQSDALRDTIAQAEALELKTVGYARDIERLQKQIDELTAAPNPHEAQLRRAIDVIDGAGAALEMRRDNLLKLEKELEIHKIVCKIFSPAGVRAHVLDEVTPFLNTQTASYLGTLSDGNISATWTTLIKTAKGDLREKFSIEVEHAEGGEGFEAISGGEKRKVRIACALALQDLVARRAIKPIELFIGDEIDDALDDPGLERLTMILEEKAKDRGTVLVISHSDISAWIGNQIIVTKKGKVSTLIEASV